MCPSKPQFLDLPQEIKDRIIALSHADTPIVQRNRHFKACSLVHRSLTWASQRELHGAVRFQWGPGTLRHTIKDETVYSDPQIAALVRKLSLWSLPRPQVDPVAWTVLARFPRLTELGIYLLDTHDWPCITSGDRDALRRTFPNVTTLNLHLNYFGYVENFLFFLTAFPNVTTLELYDLGFEPPTAVSAASSPDRPIEGIPCPRLQVLDVTYDVDLPEQADVERLLKQWIVPLTRIVAPAFKLIWFQSTLDEPTLCPQFIEALAPVLTSLDVTFPGNTFRTADLGVRHCHRLESISLSVLWDPDDGEEDDIRHATPDSDAWVYNALDQLPSSTHLQIITLDLSAKSVRDINGLNLARVDRLLAQPRFSHVKVSLVLPRMPAGLMSQEEMTQANLQMVWTTFPRLCAKEGVEVVPERHGPIVPLKTFAGFQTVLPGQQCS